MVKKRSCSKNQLLEILPHIFLTKILWWQLTMALKTLIKSFSDKNTHVRICESMPSRRSMKYTKRSRKYYWSPNPFLMFLFVKCVLHRLYLNKIRYYLVIIFFKPLLHSYICIRNRITCYSNSIGREREGKKCNHSLSDEFFNVNQ